VEGRVIWECGCGEGSIQEMGVYMLECMKFGFIVLCQSCVPRSCFLSKRTEGPLYS
jgi:hypothetical protein